MCGDDFGARMLGETKVCYTSGDTVYVEALSEGRWAGRHWSAHGRCDEPRPDWKADAFRIRIKETPSDAVVPGELLDSGWRWVEFRTLSDRKDHEHVAVALGNESVPLRLEVHTVMDGTGILMRWLELENNGERPVALTELEPWSGRLWPGEAAFTLGRAVRSDVEFEGWFGWNALEPGENVFRNNGGLLYDEPYFIVRNEGNGQYFFGQLAWPVNYAMRFTRGDGLTFGIGPTAVNALRVIESGETIATPSVHLGCVESDFDSAVQAMHAHIRKTILPELEPRLRYRTQCLAPEDRQTVYRDDAYNEANVKKMMDVAAAAGMELFIVDGPTWAKGFGNWVARPDWFPNGLDPVREHAHDKGVLFGLYAEVEGGRGDWTATAAYQRHPEWFEQGILNLAIPEAVDYMEDELEQVIKRHNLDIYRHDQNKPALGQGTETVRHGFVENDYWRHYEAFYAVTDRARQRRPALIMQQASGGGSRLDLATAKSWHEHFTSDQTGFPHVCRMVSGASVFLPPEILVTPFGMDGRGAHHLPDYVTVLRSAYTLGQTPMLFNEVLPSTVEDFTPELREPARHLANLYKTFIRPQLATCKIYHHAPVNALGGVESSDWFAMEFVSPNQAVGWATIIALSEPATDDECETFLLKPRGLDGSRSYKVTFDNTQRTEIVSGARLSGEGLPIKIGRHPRSELILFEAAQENQGGR